MKFILITGTFKAGFAFYGPFETDKDAWEFAEHECFDDYRVEDINCPTKPMLPGNQVQNDR